jgi:hypothetical protein
MLREVWRDRRDMVTGVFIGVFTGVVAVLLAVWLVAAVVLGSVEIVRMID